MANGQVQDIEFKLKFGVIAAQERKPSGEASRKILLLHGFQDNSNSYKGLIPLLPKNWWLVAIDWPGHGLSSQRGPGAAYYVTDYLTDARQVIRKLGWNRYDLIGHSLGAGVAMMYAALFPEDVEAVVSLDVVKQLSEPAGATHKSLRNAVDTLANNNLQDENKLESFSREGAVDWWFERNKQFMNRNSVSTLLERGLKETEPGKFQIARDNRLTFPPMVRQTLDQHRNILQELKCDLLIVKAAGAQNWEAEEIDNEFKEMYSKNCKRYKYTKIEGLHHTHLDNPAPVAPIIIEFLEKH